MSFRRTAQRISLLLGGALLVSLPAWGFVLPKSIAARGSATQDLEIAKQAEAAVRTLEPADGASQAAPDSVTAKSLANGLYMVGPWTATWSSGTANISLARINNDSYTRSSGTLRLELWAVSSPVSRGQGFTGYRLAVSTTFSSLSPRSYYYDIVRTASFTAPPNGTYWLNLVLAEYGPSLCSSSDGYCLADSILSDATATFGSPPPPSTVTVYSAPGSQCYQNYPYSAFLNLQQAQPGAFVSYPSSTTCASLGVTFFAGYLAGSNGTVPVYTTTQAVAFTLCNAGAVVNCTISPPSANYTDLWWNPNESGWGVSFTQHTSGIAFVAWYTYDSLGNPKWYVVSNCPVIGNGCSGTLYETTGPAFGPTFDSSRVSVRAVGSLSFVFSSSSSGTMTYSVNGMSGTKSITRQPF